MEKKIGVYICTGCGMGDAIESAALSKIATGEYKVAVCKEHPFLCSPEGASLIRTDLEEAGLNTIVIAACSPRVMTDVFDFGPDKVLERVNLREQVIWSHPANDEDTQMLAEDQLRMGIVKAREAEPPVPFVAEDLSKRILVVGGGLAGMTSANEAAKAGYEVVLVEKSDRLGGYLKEVYKLPPSQPPYEELQESNLEALTQELDNQPGIKTYLGAQIDAISGAPCMFDVHIRQNGQEHSERVGAVVLASGSVPYDPNKLERSRIREGSRCRYGRSTGSHVHRRQGDATLQRAAGQERRFHSLRRFSRPAAPPLLFGGLLCGIAQTSEIFQRKRSSHAGVRLLQGHPRQRQLRIPLQTSAEGRRLFCPGRGHGPSRMTAPAVWSSWPTMCSPARP